MEKEKPSGDNKAQQSTAKKVKRHEKSFTEKSDIVTVAEFIVTSR